MKFCKNCGYGMDDSITVCENCGCIMETKPIVNEECNDEANDQNYLTDEKLKVLSKRIKTNGIIWLIIGIAQVLLFINPVGAIIGICNIVSAIKDLKTSKKVFHYRVGLVGAYKPLVGPIFNLLFNLFLGWGFGVIGAIYYLAGIRGYVMKNADYFNALK